MERIKQPLDIYDMRPKAMTAYLSYNGWHFNKSLCEWACRHMRSREGDFEVWDKEKVDALMTKTKVMLENNVGYDAVYVCNMARADFYGTSLPTEERLAMFVKDYVDDVDQNDGFVFNRFYADCVHNGVPIPWSDVI